MKKNRSSRRFHSVGIVSSLALAYMMLLLSSAELAHGQAWTLTSAPITNWVSVGCSADGQHLIAAANNNGGAIYVSTDGGATWQQTSAPWTNWTCVAASADGTELVAAGNYTPVYFSSDGGVTWRNSTNIGPWRSVACSSDGTTIIAAGNDFPMVASGSCFSTNSGASWVLGNGGPWLATSTSAQGSKLAIAGHFYIYQHGLLSEVLISADHGASWVDAANAPALPWAAVSLSTDGSKLIALASGSGGAVSQDLGDTWTTINTPSVLWTSMATSKDCGKVLAAGNPSPLYTSPDGGNTWISNSAPVANWGGVASSADGNTLFAAVNGGGIYTWHAPTVVPGTVLWMYDARAGISSSPAIAPDNSIIFGTATGLVAVTNGHGGISNKWTFAVSNSISSSPAIALDGTVYFLNAGVGCYALNPDGTLKWSLPFQTTGLSSPAIGPDGTVYVVGDASVYAITSTGAKKWATSISSQDGSPVLAPDGTIYVATGLAGGFAALNPDGSIKSSIIGGADGTGQSAAIGADGTVYLGNAAGLYAFDPGGTLLWYSGGGSSVGFGYSSPVIAKDGTIYMVETATLNLYAFSSPAQANLTFVPGSGWKFAQVTVPAIDAQGLIYYYGAFSVYAVTPQGQVQWMVPVGGGLNGPSVTSPVIGGDGTIYIGVGTALYAIAGTNPLSDSVWPMFRQNARHTGKIERPFLALSQKGTGSSFTFQLYPNQLGLTYSIETSTNLMTWTSVTNVVATTLPTAVTDTSASNAPTRFYRASLKN